MNSEPPRTAGLPQQVPSTTPPAPTSADNQSSAEFSRRFLSDSYLFDWSRSTFREDLIFVLAIAVCLLAGILAGHPGAGMIAAGGAMTTGFGAKQNINKSRLLPMIFVAFGMSFSTFVGMVAGHDNFTLVPIVAVWGFFCGLQALRPDGYMWVAQQSVVTLLVASAYPFSTRAAAVRALLLLAGAAIQILLSTLLLRMFRELGDNLMALAHYVREENEAFLVAWNHASLHVRQGNFQDAALAYAMRLSITLAIGTEIYRHLHFASGYWIPMTSLLVLKPDLSSTVNRAIARMLGTLAGVVLITLLVHGLELSVPVLALGTLLFAWLAYSLLNVNYALFSVALTGYIVALLSINQLPEAELAHRRAISTLIGGVLALAVRLMVLERRRRVRNKSGLGTARLTT